MIDELSGIASSRLTKAASVHETPMSLGRTTLIRSFQAGRDTGLPVFSSSKMYSSRIPNSSRVLI